MLPEKLAEKESHDESEHRHRAAEALHALERLADAESILNSPRKSLPQLKKVDQKRARKWVSCLSRICKGNQKRA